ncbi:T9SS type A sorting domain-containing protein, partial [Fulvivirga sp. RKSG066]|uniref:T9SS type A sorting domain-containing protein n=1 Tax=Fulvivirga aurantia TaxID=2529383 RepID=UPI0012BC4BD6
DTELIIRPKNKSNSARIEIYSLSGVSKFKGSINQRVNKIDVSEFLPGMYLVKFSDESYQEIIKIIVK